MQVGLEEDGYPGELAQADALGPQTCGLLDLLGVGEVGHLSTLATPLLVLGVGDSYSMFSGHLGSDLASQSARDRSFNLRRYLSRAWLQTRP